MIAIHSSAALCAIDDRTTLSAQHSSHDSEHVDLVSKASVSCDVPCPVIRTRYLVILCFSTAFRLVRIARVYNMLSGLDSNIYNVYRTTFLGINRESYPSVCTGHTIWLPVSFVFSCYFDSLDVGFRNIFCISTLMH